MTIEVRGATLAKSLIDGLKRNFESPLGMFLECKEEDDEEDASETLQFSDSIFTSLGARTPTTLENHKIESHPKSGNEHANLN